MLSIPHLSSSSRRRRDERSSSSSSSTALVVLGPRSLASRSRRQRRVSKNCRTISRFGVDYVGFRRAGNVHEQRMADALAAVQSQVQALERRRALLETLHFTRYANARQLAADKVREYYDHFCSGFDPRVVDRSRVLEAIVRSILLETVESPAFATIDQFLLQWANYSKYHAKVTISIQSIQPLEASESPESVVVKCAGLTTFRISRDTIRHFFQPILNDEALVQQLVGKEYCFPFVTLFHFSADSGRVFRLEPRADLAAGLFNLVSDPFATVKLLSASQLTTDGLLNAYTEPEKPTSAGKPSRTSAAG